MKRNICALRISSMHQKCFAWKMASLKDESSWDERTSMVIFVDCMLGSHRPDTVLLDVYCQRTENYLHGV